MRNYLLTLAVGAVLAPSASAGFVHNFDMFGDYTQYLYSTTNAQVVTESDGVTRYWCPIQLGVWADVVYHYDLGFQISQASLFGIILPISPDAQAFLDVSTDGVNYTTVESGYVQSYAPYDVSSLLAGSDEVFVRARLYVDDHGPIWAQFLRSAPYLKAPFVYDFEAAPAAVVPVPEPASVSLVALGAAVLVGVRRWRSRCCGSTAAVRGLTPLDVVCDG